MSVNFDDLTKRILANQDRFEEKLDKTCTTISQMRSDFNLMKLTLNSHLEEKAEQADKKERKFYVIIAGMGIIFTLVEVFQGFA